VAVDRLSNDAAIDLRLNAGWTAAGHAWDHLDPALPKFDTMQRRETERPHVAWWMP
jgi:hypothetical protein